MARRGTRTARWCQPPCRERARRLPMVVHGVATVQHDELCRPRAGDPVVVRCRAARAANRSGGRRSTRPMPSPSASSPSWCARPRRRFDRIADALDADHLVTNHLVLCELPRVIGGRKLSSRRARLEMADVAWIAVRGFAALLEWRRPQSALSTVSAAVARRSPGRVVFVCFWAFFGWHLFTRYGVPLS